MPRCAEAGLGRGAGARRRIQCGELRAEAARRRHRLHVVRLRQHLDAESLDHAHRAAARRTAHLLQRRGRYRSGLDDGAPADRRRCARSAAGKIRARGRRHGSHRRRREDLRLAPDLCVRQCHAARGARAPRKNPGARQCRRGRRPQPGRRAPDHRQRRGLAKDRPCSVAGRRRGDRAGGNGTWDPPTTPLDENGQGVPYATYGFAAQMAEVEVDWRSAR